MTTDVMDEKQSTTEPVAETTDPREELAYLLEITKNMVHRNNTTPCASCGILVDLKINHCPHCDSDIAPNNALIRESLRRIGEIRAELDGDHAERVENDRRSAEHPGFWQRLRAKLGGEELQEPAAEITVQEFQGPRLLDSANEGDLLKVLEYDDPWYKVKTREGKVGWVYSTTRIEE